MRGLTLVPLLLLFGASSPAAAIIVDLDFSFVASGFAAGAPTDPVTGGFTVSFDNGTPIEATNVGLIVTGFNLPSKTIFYAYNSLADILAIGTGVSPNGFSLVGNQNDFAFIIRNASTNPNSFQFGYSSQINPGFYSASSVVLALASVPEPSSWAMLIAGFGLTGAAMRRRARLSVTWAGG